MQKAADWNGEDSPQHTRMEGGAEQIVCGVDVINTGRSAGTILTGCIYAGHRPSIILFRCPINNILYSTVPELRVSRLGTSTR